MSVPTPTTADASPDLTPTRAHALFDILTHHTIYSEITSFKQPSAIKAYGPPFQDPASISTPTSPILQTLLSKFVLPLPGLRDVVPDFWTAHVEDLIADLAAAELSESYDKGILGVRKTLATAISALIEYPARGVLGGIEEARPDTGLDGDYDVAVPEEVMRAWKDCLQEVVYGGLVDEIFERAAETDRLEEHKGLVRGMHEFIVVNIASLMHYTLVLSPEGPTLLRMIENVHRLIPYVVVRQTLKIGNVATMISAMMKVVLAKMSVASITNWVGLSSGADEGMNLLQQIISQVLQWDKRDFKHRADKLEKSPSACPKPVREALKDWISNSSREEHEECRRMSREQNMSIVAVVLLLSSSASVDDLTEAQHANALEWLGLRLAIRDRDQIVRVLCHRNPDLLTAGIQEAVTAYTPMIRRVHQAVNLSDTVWDFERFVTDMLKVAKVPGGGGKGDNHHHFHHSSGDKQNAEAPAPPSVEDFVDLLHRHQQSTHKFIHQVLKNDKEISSWFREYVHNAASQFRRTTKAPPPASETTPPSTGASVIPPHITHGGILPALTNIFTTLPPTDKTAITAELDAYATYLSSLSAATSARIAAVISRTRSTPLGPGGFLARWQQLLDETIVTPEMPQGKVRCGADVRDEGRKDEKGRDEGFAGVEEVVERKVDKPPGVEKVLEVFERRFRECLVQG